MKSAVMYLAIAIIIALGIGVSRGWFKNSEPVLMASAIEQSTKTLAQSSTLLPADTSSAGVFKSQPSTVAASTSTPEINSSNRAELIRSPTTIAGANVSRDHSFETKQPIENPAQDNASEQSSSDMKETLDSSVIGRSISISASLEAKCKAVGMDGEEFHDLFCRDVFGYVEKMEKEPRDSIWAAAMEAHLRDYVKSAPDKLMVRTLECRQSGCVLEVGSSANWYAPTLNPAYSSLFQAGLSAHNPIRASEVDPYGATITLTFVVFDRRTPSNP